MSDQPKPVKKRTSITKRHLNDPVVSELLTLLVEVTKDGEITDREVAVLKAWLDEHACEIPAADFLREKLGEFLSTSNRDLAARDAFHRLVIDKVLPPDLRAGAYAGFRERKEREWKVEQQLRMEELKAKYPDAKITIDDGQGWVHTRAKWENDPITDAQIDFITELGGDPTTVTTKGEASDYIDSLQAGEPAPARRTAAAAKSQGSSSGCLVIIGAGLLIGYLSLH